MTGQPCRILRKREPGGRGAVDKSMGWMTLSIIRHMSENENLLGLGSLWDTERLNVEFDEAREAERERKAQLSFGDALVEQSRSEPLTVWIADSTEPLHVRRLGQLWLDGVMCGSGDTVVVPFPAIRRAASSSGCDCSIPLPKVFELVTLGAVLRDLERKAAMVSVLVNRGGIRGRICGVWRDAVSILTARGVAIVPKDSIGGVVVEEPGRL